MPQRIVKRLFDRQEQVPPNPHVAGNGGQIRLDIEPAANRRGLQERLRILANIGREIPERVPLGVDDPNGFVHRAQQAARALTDLVEVQAGS